MRYPKDIEEKPYKEYVFETEKVSKNLDKYAVGVDKGKGDKSAQGMSGGSKGASGMSGGSKGASGMRLTGSTQKKEQTLFKHIYNKLIDDKKNDIIQYSNHYIDSWSKLWEPKKTYEEQMSAAANGMPDEFAEIVEGVDRRDRYLIDLLMEMTGIEVGHTRYAPIKSSLFGSNSRYSLYKWLHHNVWPPDQNTTQWCRDTLSKWRLAQKGVRGLPDQIATALSI